jgi:putative peptidoglycan lipid II flippase
VRAGYLEPDRVLVRSLFKFALSGVLLAATFWLTSRFAAAHLALHSFHNEIALLLLIVVGSVVYAGSILLLFGLKWLRPLVRG